ncbi:triose-phosphate isomerase [Alteromonas sp. 1_MG-2023]|uniref:triose-phosphate isomerase n=1 Tax=unclassified Alteromonas TaxID=2614992 RepID=UPI0026E1705B|nr:triose-phosphate isomerase [Alteromonas sp. 1_MG-2023]MDO6476302.1 triose-phosphate isomerase [Alteromonas sp. 1_MG-2023]
MDTVSRKLLVAGNWKMNGSRSLVEEFAASFDKAAAENIDVVICPPSILIPAFSGKGIATGAQDVSACDNGAHTGDLSVTMLKEFDCKYCIVGHSERRDDHGETSQLVAEKALKLIEAGITPVICCGEPLSVREAGQVNEFVEAQLKAVFDLIPVSSLKNAVIAYEPIWAIGTGVTASPQEAQDVHKFIREFIASYDGSLAASIQILYGGSVKPDNAKELFGQPDIDGGLIGGASLKASDFNAICHAAN